MSHVDINQSYYPLHGLTQTDSKYMWYNYQGICCASHLEDSDVPCVALHGLLKFAAFQTFLCPDAMQVLMEVQTCTQT